MRRTFRRLKERHGVSARRVAVRAHKPWYWRWLIAVVLLLAGYGLGFLHALYNGGFFTKQVSEQEKALLAQLVIAERQLQVERAAQISTAKEMSALQGEVMRLKEDVAFYNSILSESDTASVVRLHSVRLNKGEQVGEFSYHILLVQSGRHDKTVQGVLRLKLQGLENESPVQLDMAKTGRMQGISVKFKYYQRLDGSFTVPEGVQGQSVLVEFDESGGKHAKLTKEVSLTE